MEQLYSLIFILWLIFSGTLYAVSTVQRTWNTTKRKWENKNPKSLQNARGMENRKQLYFLFNFHCHSLCVTPITSLVLLWVSQMWIEFGRIQLPPSHHPNDVEKEWGKLIVAMLEREKRLRPELERYEQRVRASALVFSILPIKIY